MKKISHCLLFDSQAEEAARYYTSLFPDGKLGRISRYGTEGNDVHGQPAGKVMTAEFEMGGLKYVALNGGPIAPFNESFSIVVTCDAQEEVDELWEKLARDGEEVQCGWLKDKFDVCWQIVPKGFVDLVTDPDPQRAARAMKAMMKMKKLDIHALRAAVDG